MKKIFTFLAIISLNITRTSAQNIFPEFGNVGVGTIAPNTILDIYNASNTSRTLVRISGSQEAPSSMTGVLLGAGGLKGRGKGGIFFQPHGTTYGFGKLHFAVNETPGESEAGLGDVKLTVLGSGNVGIGTVDPSSKLEVSGATRLGGGIDYGNSTVLSVAPGNIAFDGPGDPGGRLTILGSNGNVGLGTRNPNARLDVNGVIQTYNKDNTGAYWDNLRLWSDGGSSHIESSGDENGLYLRSNGADKIVLSSNVGVGTDNTKGYKLAVAGNAIAESMTIKVHSQWPDYVLKRSYILPSLSNVQTFINKNGHLPDIPAASVLEKDGLNLGELVQLQMKKIEELTLYILQQQRAIKGQAEQISKINKQLKKVKK